MYNNAIFCQNIFIKYINYRKLIIINKSASISTTTGGIAFRFAFNVGNGLQVLEVTTAYWLNNDQWHQVRLERNRKESRLIVDSNPAKVLVEPQERSFLMYNFDQPLFVGTTQVIIS